MRNDLSRVNRGMFFGPENQQKTKLPGDP